MFPFTCCIAVSNIDYEDLVEKIAVSFHNAKIRHVAQQDAVQVDQCWMQFEDITPI